MYCSVCFTRMRSPAKVVPCIRPSTTAGIPAVVEGRMQGTTFAGDRILVKHTEQYIEENPDRVPEGAP